MLKRDARGRFTPGTAPGPGRPPKNAPPIRLEDDPEAASLVARANTLINEFDALFARYPDD